MFLDLPLKEIGCITGESKAFGRHGDLAPMQSLNHRGVVRNCVAEYGHVIVDECHHVSAFSFELVLRKTKAKFVVGLMATPVLWVQQHIQPCAERATFFRVNPKS